jgi:hypothetical protein
MDELVSGLGLSTADDAILFNVCTCRGSVTVMLALSHL